MSLSKPRAAPVFAWFAAWGCLGLLFSGCQLLCGTGGGPQKLCESDGVCGAGLICVARRCVEGCRQDSDCTNQRCFELKCSDSICKAGTTRPCYEGAKGTDGVGTCKKGTQFCLANGTSWSACLSQKLPGTEICDKADNDCDGKIDEELNCQCTTGARRFCYSGAPTSTKNVGLCASGIQYCEKDSKWGRCFDETLPAAEVCNGKDDDCDGNIDDGLTCECLEPGTQRECYSFSPELLKAKDALKQQLACSAGTQICLSTGVWGKCHDEVGPKTEICDNRLDDDCDGQIDEDCVCLPGAMVVCYEKPDGTGKMPICKLGKPYTCACREKGGNEYECKGTCLLGVKFCRPDGTWSDCLNAIFPTKEICNNGKDDDCNGKIDDC